MTNADVYRITDQLDDATLDVLVTRLEIRAQHPRVVPMIDDYLNAMQIDQAQRVLDLGCGTGVIARRIARRPNFSGHVLGVDLSDYLIRAANGFAQKEGLTDRVEFRTGDSQLLTLPDAAFDAIVIHTMVSHVNDVDSVVRHCARMLAPGGVIALFDGDYASMTFGGDDVTQGRKIDEAIIGAIATQPRIMRQLPEVLHSAGLKIVRTFAYVLEDMGRADYWGPAIQSFRALLPKSGNMSAEQANAWADQMDKRSEQGTFFGACNFYTYVVQRS